eukprot:SAG31_NODE_124_length_23684_cov_7.200127_14_plen_3059_part_00
MFATVLQSPVAHFRVHKSQTTVYEEVHQRIDASKSSFVSLFDSQSYMQCLQVHEMVTKLSPDSTAFKQQVQDLTTDMKTIGDTAMSEEKFEIALGAYNLGLLYNSDDKKMTLAQKKASGKYMHAVTSETIDWMTVQLEIDECKVDFESAMKSGEFLAASKAYKFLVENVDRAQGFIAGRGASFKDEADKLLKSRNMQREAEDCFRDWQYDNAVGAYRLALAIKPEDKRLRLALKKAETKAETVRVGKDTRAEQAKLQAAEQLPRWMFEADRFITLNRLPEATSLYAKVQSDIHCDDEIKSSIFVVCEKQELKFAEVMKAEDYSRALDIHQLITTLSADDREEMRLLQTHFNQMALELTATMKDAGDKAFKKGDFEVAVSAYKLAILYRSKDKRLALALKKADMKWQQQILDEQEKSKATLDDALAEGDRFFQGNRFSDAKSSWLAVQKHKYATQEMQDAVKSRANDATKKFEEVFSKKRYMWALDVYDTILSLTPTDDEFIARVKDMTTEMRPVGEEAYRENKYETAVGAYKLGLLYNGEDKKLILGLRKAEKKWKEIQAEEEMAKASKQNAAVPKLQAIMKDAEESWSQGRHGYAIMKWTAVQNDKYITQDMMDAISERCDEAEAKFDDCFATKQYSQALEMFEMITTLSPARDDFKARVSELASDMRTVGDTAFKDSNFEMAVGAYKFALMKEPGNKRIILSLKKAETKWRALKKSQAADRSEALPAFFDQLERKLYADAWKHFKVARVDKFGTVDNDFVEKARTAISSLNVDLKSVGDDALEAQTYSVSYDGHSGGTLSLNVAMIESSIAAYQLGLVQHEGDKKILLALKKAEKHYRQLQERQEDELRGMVTAELLEWFVKEVEIIDNKQRFDVAMGIESEHDLAVSRQPDYLVASNTYVELIERIGHDKEFQDYFAKVTVGIDRVAHDLLAQGGIIAAVGAFRLATVNSEDKKLLLASRKAEKLYAKHIAAERQKILDSEMVAKEGMMRLEGIEDDDPWEQRYVRILVGGDVYIYDGHVVGEQGLSYASILLQFNCSACEALIPEESRPSAPFCFQLDWYVPSSDEKHLDLEESLVLEPIEASDVERSMWIDLIQTPPPPTEPPETLTDEEAEVHSGAVKTEKKFKLKQSVVEERWLRVVTGGSLYIYEDDSNASKLIEKLDGIRAELPKVKSKKELLVAPFIFIVKSGKEERYIEVQSKAARKEWIDKISHCPERTIGNNYKCSQIAFAKYSKIGDQSCEKAEWDAASTAYKKALEILPTNVHVRRNLEQVEAFIQNEITLSEQEKAEAKAKRIAIMDAARKLDEGNLALRKKRNEDALRLFTEGTQLDPENRKLQLALRKVQKILAALEEQETNAKRDAEEQAKRKELDTVDAQEIAILEQEMSVDDLDVVDEVLLWPFSNLVKIAWMKVEVEKSSSGQWIRRLFKLQAGGQLAYYEGENDEQPERVIECKWCDLSLPKTSRKDAPYAFRIDFKNYLKNGNRQKDGKLIVEVETMGNKGSTRDQWMEAIRNPPDRIEDGPDIDDEIRQKREERRAKLMEKRRELTQQRKEKELQRAEYDRLTEQRRMQIVREQEEKEAAAAELRRRTDLARSGKEIGDLDEQRKQRDFHLAEGDRYAAGHAYDEAVEEYTLGLNTDYDDPRLEDELLNGWFHIKDVTNKTDWRKTYLRLVTGGVIYCHWDNTRQLVETKRLSDLEAEYAVKEGYLFVEPSKGKAWEQHWFKLVSGGALYVYRTDPNPNPEDASMVIYKGPVRVRTYTDASLDTQTSEWQSLHFILTGNGVLHFHLADPSTSVNKKNPANARVIRELQCQHCKIGEPARDKEFMKEKIHAYVIEQPGEDVLLVEPIERMPSEKKFREAWVNILIEHSSKIPEKPYLRLPGKDYTVSELKNARKDASQAWRIDSTTDEKQVKLVVTHYAGKKDEDEDAAKAAAQVAAEEKKSWMKTMQRPPPLRVMPTISATMKICSFEDTTLNTSIGPWEERFLLLQSDGHLQMRLDNPTKRRYENDPTGARIVLQCSIHDLTLIPAANVKQLLHSEVKKDLKKHPHCFQLDFPNETILVDAGSASQKQEWIKLLKDPLANSFEEDGEPSFEPTDDNMGLRMRTKHCDVEIPDKKTKGYDKKLGGGSLLLLKRQLGKNYQELMLDPMPFSVQTQKKWSELIAECPRKNGVHLDDVFTAKIAQMEVDRTEWQKVLQARAVKAEQDAKAEAERRLAEKEQLLVKENLSNAVQAAYEADSKLMELEARAQKRKEEKEEREEAAKQKELDALLKDEAKALEKEIKKEKNAMGKEERERRKQEAIELREQKDRERIEKRQKELLIRNAEEDRMLMYQEYRTMYDPKYYSGFFTMRIKGGGSNKMWAVINDGCLQLWRQRDGIEFQWVWETLKPTHSMGLLAISRLRAFHDEGTVVVTKRIKDTGFFIASETQEWYVKTESEELAENWVKWISISRCVVAARAGMQWLISNPKTLHLTYKFFTEEEMLILRERQRVEDERIAAEKRQVEEEENARREELNKQNAEMLAVKKKEAEEERARVEIQTKLAKRANLKEQDKIIYSFPPEHEFDLRLQPFGILVPALSIIRAKVGWLMHKTAEMEAVQGKNDLKKVVGFRRYFVVMWRHPQAESGHYDMLKYETDDDMSNDGPLDIIRLRNTRLSAASEPVKDRPGRFIVRCMSKPKGATKPEVVEHEFDARTKAEAANWVDFIVYGPDFSIDFNSKIDAEMRAKQKAIDEEMRKEAIAERGRRAAADLARRQQQQEEASAPTDTETETDVYHDPKEDRQMAKEMLKQAKQVSSEAEYHMKMGTAAKKRGQQTNYEDHMVLYSEKMSEAKDLKLQAENLNERARVTKEQEKAAPKKSEIKNVPEDDVEQALAAEVAALEAEELQESQDGTTENPLANDETVEDLVADDNLELEDVSVGTKKDSEKKAKKDKKPKKSKKQKKQKASTSKTPEALALPQEVQEEAPKQGPHKIIETWSDSKDMEILNPLAEEEAEEIQTVEEQNEDRFQVPEGMSERGLVAKAAKLGNTSVAVGNKVTSVTKKEKKKKKKKSGQV